MDELCVLHIQNVLKFINIEMRGDCRDYIGKISHEFRTYKF